MLLDQAVSVGLAASLVAVALAYGMRVAMKGAARSARVESAGSSSFLGRFPMEMTYWALTPIGRALVSLGISANAVTAASLVLGVGAGFALAFGHFGVGAALSALSALGDALDGYVARESGTASDAGETFDAAVDRYNEFFFLGGLAIAYRESALLLTIVLVALAGSFMVSYATAKAEALAVEPPRGSMRRAERAAYLTVGSALVPSFAVLVPRFGDAPLLFALLVVGVVSNGSSIRRLRRIAELVRARDAARAPITPAAPTERKPDSAELRSLAHSP